MLEFKFDEIISSMEEVKIIDLMDNNDSYLIEQTCQSEFEEIQKNNHFLALLGTSLAGGCVYDINLYAIHDKILKENISVCLSKQKIIQTLSLKNNMQEYIAKANQENKASFIIILRNHIKTISNQYKTSKRFLTKKERKAFSVFIKNILYDINILLSIGAVLAFYDYECFRKINNVIMSFFLDFIWDFENLPENMKELIGLHQLGTIRVALIDAIERYLNCEDNFRVNYNNAIIYYDLMLEQINLLPPHLKNKANNKNSVYLKMILASPTDKKFSFYQLKLLSKDIFDICYNEKKSIDKVIPTSRHACYKIFLFLTNKFINVKEFGYAHYWLQEYINTINETTKFNPQLLNKKFSLSLNEEVSKLNLYTGYLKKIQALHYDFIIKVLSKFSIDLSLMFDFKENEISIKTPFMPVVSAMKKIFSNDIQSECIYHADELIIKSYLMISSNDLSQLLRLFGLQKQYLEKMVNHNRFIRSGDLEEVNMKPVSTLITQMNVLTTLCDTRQPKIKTRKAPYVRSTLPKELTILSDARKYGFDEKIFGLHTFYPIRNALSWRKTIFMVWGNIINLESVSQTTIDKFKNCFVNGHLIPCDLKLTGFKNEKSKKKKRGEFKKMFCKIIPEPERLCAVEAQLNEEGTAIAYLFGLVVNTKVGGFSYDKLAISLPKFKR